MDALKWEQSEYRKLITQTYVGDNSSIVRFVKWFFDRNFVIKFLTWKLALVASIFILLIYSPLCWVVYSIRLLLVTLKINRSLYKKANTEEEIRELNNYFKSKRKSIYWWREAEYARFIRFVFSEGWWIMFLVLFQLTIGIILILIIFWSPMKYLYFKRWARKTNKRI